MKNLAVTMLLLCAIAGCRITPHNPNKETKSMDKVSIDFDYCKRTDMQVVCYFNVRSDDKQKHLFIHYQTSAQDNEGNQYCLAGVRIGETSEQNDPRCEEHSTAGLLVMGRRTPVQITFKNISPSAKLFAKLELRGFAGRNRNVNVISFMNLEF